MCLLKMLITRIWCLLFLFDIFKLKPNLDIIDAELWAEALNPNNQVWTNPFCIFVNICAPTNYFVWLVKADQSQIF